MCNATLAASRRLDLDLRQRMLYAITICNFIGTANSNCDCGRRHNHVWRDGCLRLARHILNHCVCFLCYIYIQQILMLYFVFLKRGFLAPLNKYDFFCVLTPVRSHESWIWRVLLYPEVYKVLKVVFLKSNISVIHYVWLKIWSAISESSCNLNENVNKL